jgi:hypothetical protein
MQTKHQNTCIRQLAIQTIQAIEEEHNSRIFTPTHSACKQALEQLKTNSNKLDIELFLVFYHTFNKLQQSDIRNKHNSFTCQKLSLFLFETREIIVKEYNWLSEVIAGRTTINEDTTNTSTQKKVFLENENTLSLLDKRISLEKHDQLIFILDKLGDALKCFNPDIFPTKLFTPINKIPVLYIFKAFVDNNDIDGVQKIMASNLAMERINMLSENWNNHPYTYMKSWIREHNGTSWAKPIDTLHAFLNDIQSHANFDLMMLITKSSWFLNFISPEQLRKTLESTMISCELNGPDKVQELKKIDFYLSAYKQKLDQAWLKEQFGYQSDAEIKALIGKHCPEIIAQFIPLQYLLFFGTKDPGKSIHFSSDIKNELQKNCLEITLPEILSPWKKNQY